MRTELEDQQVEQYREQGFLRLDRFLSADELDDLTHRTFHRQLYIGYCFTVDFMNFITDL